MLVGGRDGVGEAVGSNLGRVGIVDGDGEIRLLGNAVQGDFAKRAGEESGGIGNHGADRGVGEGDAVQGLADRFGAEFRGGNDGSPLRESVTIGQGKLGAGVGVIDQELHEKGLLFEDLDFVAVGIGDEGHLALAGREFFAPATWPDFDAVVFELIAVGDDVWDADAGVHEVLGEFDFVVRRVGQFEEVFVAGEIHKGEFVALGGFFLLAKFEADFLVEGDGGGGVGNADAGVEKLNHGGSLESSADLKTAK